MPDNFILYMKSLVGKPIEFYSCFISYSSKDDDFAKRLHADLQAQKIPCWFAPEHLKIGDKFRPRIKEAIRVHDKLLLVLSENSVKLSHLDRHWLASYYVRHGRECYISAGPGDRTDSSHLNTAGQAHEVRGN
jgi:hypothetical protein